MDTTTMTDPTETVMPDVAALLEDLELQDVVEDTGSEIIESLDDSDVAAVEIAAAVADAHESEEVTSTDVAAPETTSAPATEKKERKAASPRAPRDLNAIDAAHFQLREGGANDEANRDAVIATRPSQKKVAEKFDNLFQSVAAGRKPSTYTAMCFAVLDAKKTVTQGDLVAALKGGTVGVGKTKGSTFHEGTARSQAGQMMALFAAVGIATRSKQTLELNADSVLAAKLRALI